ncbi:MAG: hypothetical protein LUG45_04330 [Clostridiales bacterium]|nr:hypothetical protein [Clostridiales bacterium]
MKEITILLTKYSDRISSFVYLVCCGGYGYTHASISLEENPNIFYSFNYKGFTVETMEKHKRHGVTQSRSYRLYIPEDSYSRIQEVLERFMERKNLYHYTRLGVLCCMLHIPLHWEDHYFCSHFVADLLNVSGAFPMKKTASLYLPNDFIGLAESQPDYRIIMNPV